MTKSELENRIAVLLGGRVAEELIYQEVSTGARDDLLKATDIAKSMVKAYGMSDKLGRVSFDGERQPLFLRTGQAAEAGEYSEATARDIDGEVRRIIEEQYARVTTLLTTQRETLRKAAAVLLQKEVITGEELRAIVVEAEAVAEEKTAATVH